MLRSRLLLSLLLDIVIIEIAMDRAIVIAVVLGVGLREVFVCGMPPFFFFSY